MTRRALIAITPLLLALGAEGDCFGGGGDPASEACDEAKQHVCDNIEGQGCSADNMGDAVARVEEECTADVADAFVPAVEQACQENALGECQSL